MIDFHSHILPAFDDGAEDVQTSLQMLRQAYEDGINTIIATSHAYIINDKSVDKFLEKRAESYEKLKEAMAADGGHFPEIKLGAEVHIKSFLANLDNIGKLAIEGTNYILIEMPYTAWKQEHYESVYNCSVSKLRPIIAHAERYLERADKLRHLKAFGAIFQVNADSFMSKQTRKQLLNMFYDGYAHILGSDMHNTTTRPNRMKDAYLTISETFGDAFLEYVMRNADLVLANKSVKDGDLPNIPFFKKIMM